MQVQRTYASRLIAPALVETALTANSALGDSSRAGAPAPPLLYAVGIHQNLACLSGLQALHGLAEIFHRDSIGDHRMQVQFAALQQRGHLIPGLVHAASVDALDRNSLEDDVFGEVQRDRFRCESEQRNSSSSPHDVERSANRVGMSRHFEDDIYAQAARLLHHDLIYVFFRRIEYVVRLHLACNAGAVFVHLDRENGSSADRFGDGNREQSDWATAGDRDRFGRDFPGENGVDCVAQWIEDRGIFQWNRGIEFPDIRFGDEDVFGKCAVGVNANDLYVLADVSFTGPALQAFAAGDMHLGRNEVALLHTGDFIAKCGDLSAELVARNQRWMNSVLRPAVPVVNVEISAANRRDLHLDQYIGAAEGGDLYLANIGARSRFGFDHRHHCSSHNRHL